MGSIKIKKKVIICSKDARSRKCVEKMEKVRRDRSSVVTGLLSWSARLRQEEREREREREREKEKREKREKRERKEKVSDFTKRYLT